MLKVGLIGFGYWGPNLARNINSNPSCKLAHIVDSVESRLNSSAVQFPGIATSKDALSMINETSIDAVVIATPLSTHYSLAKAALLAGKHVLVTKPFTSSSTEGKELIELAERKNKTLMVDQTYIFSGAVVKMKELLRSGEIGEVLYYDSVRINLGLFQIDTNVFWDLAPHDLSILDYLIDRRPTAVAAHGSNHFNRFEDVGYLTLVFEENLIAHFHVNWLSPVKIRRTIVGGAKKMIVWDDLDPEHKLKIYSKGVTIGQADKTSQVLAEYRIGDMYSPNLQAFEALQSEIAHFVNCIATQSTPLSSAAMGLRVISILEAADKSLSQNGKFVEINSQ